MNWMKTVGIRILLGAGRREEILEFSLGVNPGKLEEKARWVTTRDLKTTPNKRYRELRERLE